MPLATTFHAFSGKAPRTPPLPNQLGAYSLDLCIHYQTRKAAEVVHFDCQHMGAGDYVTNVERHRRQRRLEAGSCTRSAGNRGRPVQKCRRAVISSKCPTQFDVTSGTGWNVELNCVFVKRWGRRNVRGGRRCSDRLNPLRPGMAIQEATGGVIKAFPLFTLHRGSVGPFPWPVLRSRLKAAQQGGNGSLTKVQVTFASFKSIVTVLSPARNDGWGVAPRNLTKLVVLLQVMPVSIHPPEHSP